METIKISNSCPSNSLKKNLKILEHYRIRGLKGGPELGPPMMSKGAPTCRT